jgi:hypothetical protein
VRTLAAVVPTPHPGLANGLLPALPPLLLPPALPPPPAPPALAEPTGRTVRRLATGGTTAALALLRAKPEDAEEEEAEDA